jgi:AbrB family looped-hinge helix DNA binding protein
MRSTLTSKGQITIPLRIRQKFHLKPGDTLVFDESAPFLKATKLISPEAWDSFGRQWKDPWPEKTLPEVLDDIRGPVELPHPSSESKDK